MKIVKVIAVAAGLSMSINVLAQGEQNNTIDGLTVEELDGESVINGQIDVQDESVVNLNSIIMNGGKIEDSTVRHRLNMTGGSITAEKQGKIDVNTVSVSGNDTVVNGLEAELDTEISGEIKAADGTISIGSIYARAKANIQGMVVKAKNIINGNVAAVGTGSEVGIGSVTVDNSEYKGAGTTIELNNTVEDGGIISALDGGEVQLGSLKIENQSNVSGLNFKSDNTVTGSGGVVAIDDGSVVKVGAMSVNNSRITAGTDIETKNTINAFVTSKEGAETAIGAIDLENNSVMSGENSIKFDNTINQAVTTTGPGAITSIGSLRMRNSSLSGSTIESNNTIDGQIDNLGTMRIGSVDLNNAQVDNLTFKSTIKVNSPINVGKSSELNVGSVVTR